MSITISILAGVIYSAFSIIPQPNGEPADTTLQFDEIVVTASKIAQTERETTKPVIVITRAEIERSGGQDLAQLLQTRSGIRVNQSHGAPGENKTLFMQGAGSGYTLLLIDGLAVNDPSGVGGLFDIRMIPTESVERIEIIKGSQSTLYGTDAVAGVVNIITRKNSQQPFGMNGKLSYGRYNTFNGSAGADGRINDMLSYRFNYSRETTDGFSAAAEPDDFDPAADREFEADGFTRNTFTGSINITPLSSVTISPFLNYSTFSGDFDADAFREADNRFEMDFINPGITARYDGVGLRVFAGYNFSSSDRIYTNEAFGESLFKGKLHNLDGYAVYAINPNLDILGGINYQDNILPGADGQDDISAEILSPYATLLLKGRNGFNAEIGVRLNNHSEYGNNTTYSFAPSYLVTENVKLFGSLSTGFKVPSLDQLFGPFGPNPDLDPERSRYVNTGIEFYSVNKTLKASAQYFNRQIDDVIVYTDQYTNRDRQNDSGIELQADWLAGSSLKIGAFYNYVTGELTSFGPDGEETTTDNLLRRPAHSLGGSVGYSVTPDLFIRLRGEFNSERDDVFFNPITFAPEPRTLDAYSLFHIYAEYSLMENQIRLFTNIQNLFNTSFTEVYGFNTMGFNATAGVRFSL